MVQLDIQISIITINYNGLKDTCELIDTLPIEDESLEVIVVDNASKEDEAIIIEQRYPQVKVIRSKENLGFAGGNNLGIQAARGKYLFLSTTTHFSDLRPQTSDFSSIVWSLLQRLVRFVPRSGLPGATILYNLQAIPHSLA